MVHLSLTGDLHSKGHKKPVPIGTKRETCGGRNAQRTANPKSSTENANQISRVVFELKNCCRSYGVFVTREVQADFSPLIAKEVEFLHSLLCRTAGAVYRKMLAAACHSTHSSKIKAMLGHGVKIVVNKCNQPA
jgi:hypothetical protein